MAISLIKVTKCDPGYASGYRDINSRADLEELAHDLGPIIKTVVTGLLAYRNKDRQEKLETHFSKLNNRRLYSIAKQEELIEKGEYYV